MRILCVDDDDDTCFLLTTLLGRSGLEAVCVPDSTAALRLIAGEQFSLYVIDGQLPGVSGLTLCEQIRALDRQTPVIIFSGHGHVSDRAAGLHAGANAYIVKPSIEILIPTVKRLLNETHGAARTT